MIGLEIKTTRKRKRFIAWLLVALLLWVGAVAAAHELDHILDQHQELCALHHYAGHHGGLPSVYTHSSVSLIEVRFDFPSSYLFVAKSRPTPYAVRAPPLHSEI